jgi:hypothetical protein
MKIFLHCCFVAMSALIILTPAVASAAADGGAQTPSPVSGRSLSDPSGILPADALARVHLLRANVELLRRYMGRKAPPRPLLQVSSARPGEVYSQALNLEMRANRLAFEQVRVVRNPSIGVAGEPAPADVFRVVDLALNSILLVKKDMKIRTAIAEVVQPEQTTPTEVFNAVVLAGTEINNLLQDMTSPSDVFQLVTAATHIAASLHATIPGKSTLPPEPDFVSDKMPADVFARMRNCFEMVSELASARGISTLEFAIMEDNSRTISPNDVGDMAALLVEELRHVHSKFPAARQPTQAYYPGKRFPSHVYQRVGFLEKILQDLLDAYAAVPPG